MARLVQRDGGDDLRRSPLGARPALVDLGNRQPPRNKEIEKGVRKSLMYLKVLQVGL